MKEPTQTTPGTPPVASTPPRILLVEDDACAAFLFKTLLEKDGYSVTHSSDGQSALDIVMNQRFDAIVLDLMMPKVDGIQVLKAVRAAPLNPLVPVVIITAARLKVVEEEAARLGVKLFLDKTRTDQLLQAVRKILADRGTAPTGALRMAPVAPMAEKVRRGPPAAR